MKPLHYIAPNQNYGLSSYKGPEDVEGMYRNAIYHYPWLSPIRDEIMNHRNFHWLMNWMPALPYDMLLNNVQLMKRRNAAEYYLRILIDRRSYNGSVFVTEEEFTQKVHSGTGFSETMALDEYERYKFRVYFYDPRTKLVSSKLYDPMDHKKMKEFMTMQYNGMHSIYLRNW